MKNWLYDAACAVLGAVYAVVLPSKIIGLENIPAEGGFVMCANHLHARDPLYLAAHFKGRRLHFMAKAELFRFKPLGALIGAVGGFPVERGKADLNSVRTALNVVKEGEGLGIFPQGTRSKTNERLPMLTGTAMIAMRANAPVIPVFIDGPYRAFRRTNVFIGSAVDVARFGRRADAETLSAVTEAIEDAVWQMKPNAAR